MKIAQKLVVKAGRYGVVGIATNLSVYLLFLLLIRLGLDAVVASALCYCLGVLLSYLLNRTWTFESTAKHRSDAPRFLLAYGGGLILNIILMWILVDPLGAALAQLVSIVLVAGTIFAMLSVLRFGKGT